jgi:hypothetical protein
VTVTVIDPEVLAKLKALGIEPGGAPTWLETKPLDAAKLPSVQKQRELLAQLRDALKAQLDEDIAKLEQAHIDLERVRNGGGS